MSDWVIRLIEDAGYLGVAFLMFLETVFPPIPSEVIMSVAGVTAAKGQMSLAWAIVSGTAGAMLGNIFWYLVARALGIIRLRPFIEQHGRWLTLTWREVERAEGWFRHYGTFFVFLGRMLPTVRSLVSVPAGLLRMRFRTFFFFSTLGTAGWTAAIAVAGYKLRERFTEVDQWLGPISNAILVTLVLGYVWRLVTYKPAERS
ncbi:DedA family protein [Sphingomonas sp. BN140010]|uniref:DedA family protein n=1 Tax=Sphingomonas arvum TaxID=2992113 RepID=A0ABT3JHU6_9SPHN|nr:DedA family protein [Sphingomonas sp. BN140010]MCW3798653.1 DedA family protein [Sphingomonas sp. BN140010]